MGSIIQHLFRRERGKGAAHSAIRIDFSQTDGEMIPKTGWLLIPNENIPDGRILPLNTRVVRDDLDTQVLLGNHAGSDDDAHFEDVYPNERNRMQRIRHGKARLDSLGIARYYPILGHMPSWISASGRPQSPPKSYALWKQWVKDIVQYMKDSGLGVTEFNVWNESFGGVSAGGDVFNRMYAEAWQAAKEVMPEAKLIGPSPWTSDKSIQSFAKACAAAEIPLDAVAWHFGDYQNLPGVQKNYERYIQRYPVLGTPKYYYEEYADTKASYHMQTEFTILANIDRAKIDTAIRGIWYYSNGLSDMLKTDQNDENPYQRQNVWWQMAAYGSMSGMRVKQSGASLYIASYDREKCEAKILLGNQSGELEIQMENFPFAGKPIRIHKYRLTSDEQDGLQYQGSDSATAVDGTVCTRVNFSDPDDVWMLVVQTAKSAPSDFMLKAPDDGFAAGLTPEFSWQPAPGAESYTLTISKDRDLKNPVFTKSGIRGTAYQLEAKDRLQQDATYYWSVKAVNSHGEKEPYNGAYYSFLASEDLDIPGPFTMLQVIDWDFGTDLTPKFTWTQSRHAEKYKIHLSKREDFPEETILEITDPPLHDIGQENKYLYFSLPSDKALSPETRYFAKVEAVNGHGSREMNGGAHTFITTTADRKPAAFRLTVPADGAVLEPRSTLRWERSLGAFFYRLCIAADPACKEIVLQRDTVTVPSYTLEADLLKPNTTYYWRVTAVTKDGKQETDCQNGVRRFTTSSLPAAPIVKTAFPAPGGAVVVFDAVRGADSYIVKYGTASKRYTGSVLTLDTKVFIPLTADGTDYFTAAAIRDGMEGSALYEVSMRKEKGDDSDAWCWREKLKWRKYIRRGGCK